MIELRFARDNYWAYELTTADMEEGMRAQWRPSRPPRSVLMRSGNANNAKHTSSKEIRILMKPDCMGSLRVKWMKWPSLRRVKKVQAMMVRELRTRDAKRKKGSLVTKKGWFGFGINSSNDDQDVNIINTESGGRGDSDDDTIYKDGSGDHSRGGRKINQETSENAIELYMACTTGNMDVVKRLMELPSISTLARFRYGWDGRGNSPVCVRVIG